MLSVASSGNPAARFSLAVSQSWRFAYPLRADILALTLWVESVQFLTLNMILRFKQNSEQLLRH